MVSINDFKLLFRLMRYKLQKYRFPAHVVISVTNKCNLSCPYCFARYVVEKEDRLNTETMFSLIDKLHKMGARYINLTGGEPLTRRDIKDIIHYISRKKGMKCSLSTNGTLLQEKIEVLKRVDSINVSLDGNEEQHNQNRQSQLYGRIIKGIETAVANNIPVTTCTVLTKSNMGCVDDIARLAKEKGFMAVFHLLRVGLEPNDDLMRQQLSQQEIREAMQKIIDYKKTGYPIYYSNKCHAYIRDWPYEHPSRMLRAGDGQAEKKFKIIPCVCGDLSCFIDGEGRVYPCAVLSGQVKVLNFLEAGFEDAWNFLPQVRCKACSFFFQTELNLLLSLCPSVWKNFITTSKILR